MTGRRPGEGRYAQLEREQRWLVRALPDDVTNERVIVDRYWTGTTLRLRMVHHGEGVDYKLCQKVRVKGEQPDVVRITNIYLNEGEYQSLSVAPASIIQKSRWVALSHGVPYSVDEFKGRHAGLVLAEIEVGEHESPVDAPEFAISEVTMMNEYSGGSLAEASTAELLRLIPR